MNQELAESETSKSNLAKMDQVYKAHKQKKVADTSNPLKEFYHTSFLVLTVKNYQKSTIWFSLLLGLLSMRGANPFTVWLAYISLVLRVI